MTADFIARVKKRFTPGTMIEIDLERPINDFGVLALFGPSGCGKTTVLRLLAGLIRPDEGVIEVDGKVWYSSDERISLSPQQRDIGFLFQDYALFPHLNVAENIGFGIRSLPADERQNRLAEILELFELQQFDRRLPHQLSGGQQQRVALARALIRRPKLLLLDEPLSALDSILREQLRGELRQRLAQLKTPVIVVTHDRVEAIALADQVAAMDSGVIQQIGSVADVFNRPKNALLAKLFGVETIALGEIVGASEGLATVRVGSTQLIAVAPERLSRHVHVCIKGEDVALQRGSGAQSSVRNHLDATIVSIVMEGPLVRLSLDCGFPLTSLVTRPACEELQLAVGDRIVAMLKAPAIHLIPAPGHTE